MKQHVSYKVVCSKGSNEIEVLWDTKNYEPVLSESNRQKGIPATNEKQAIELYQHTKDCVRKNLPDFMDIDCVSLVLPSGMKIFSNSSLLENPKFI